jgi:hypothetical protein
LALWTTFHPTQVRRARFVARVTQLYRDHIRLSVGVVGLREHFPDIARLCDELPPEVYLWINAYKRRVPYYSEEETLWLTAIDPFFPINNQQHECLGRPCAAGATSFAVDGQGIMRRCHFVEKPIGNIHSATWKASLRAAPCPKATCGCHIGYIFLPHLGQSLVYGENLLERIPIAIPARRATGL